MSGGFDVDSQELTRHSATVAAVASDVRECGTAAGQEGVGGLVYGVLFDPTLLPILSEAKNHIAHMISAAGDTGEAISDGLATNAKAYSKIEADLKKNFSSLVTGTDGAHGD